MKCRLQAASLLRLPVGMLRDDLRHRRTSQAELQDTTILFEKVDFQQRSHHGLAVAPNPLKSSRSPVAGDPVSGRLERLRADIDYEP